MEQLHYGQPTNTKQLDLQMAVSKLAGPLEDQVVPSQE